MRAGRIGRICEEGARRAMPLESPQTVDAMGKAPGSRSGVEGVGLGLRAPHEPLWCAGGDDLPRAWFEVLSDNYAHAQGPSRRRLGVLRERHEMVLHGVGMSLGSTDPIDRDYVGRIAALARDLEPAWISEHLAWTSVGGRHHHELLPLPFIDESVETLARNIRQVQDRLGTRLVVENSAAYLAFEASQMSECDFVTSVLHEADCDLLLDVNNLYVNARNHGFDPVVYLESIPPERVRQMHLGGHDDHGDILIDAHGSAVAEPVWVLYAEAVRRFPGVPTSIEWDRDVPPLDVLLAEQARAESVVAGVRRTPHAGERVTHAP